MNSALSGANSSDLTVLAQHGICPEEIDRQWKLLHGPLKRVTIDRPCNIGDGIQRIDPSEYACLLHRYHQSAAKGRWTRFVPASGDASRMFALCSDSDKRRFVESLGLFAFGAKLQQQFRERHLHCDALVREERYDELIGTVLASDGLGYGNLPKGLIEFHQYADGPRTPFEEHLWESVACHADNNGNAVAHFTVASRHLNRFAERLRHVRATLKDLRCLVRFSAQDASTDTITIDTDRRLLRNNDGKPLLRPGGHGAVIKNLDKLNGDLVFVKNIDNVLHESQSESTARWMQIIGGYLVRLQNAVHNHLRTLQSRDACNGAAHDFVELTFPGTQLPESGADTIRTALISRLRRPIRVCGMVANKGDSGGAPFWVRQANGDVTPQIVECAEVDSNDSEQQSLFEQATHFNPVFMVLAVRDEHDRAYNLSNFVDNERSIVTEKLVGQKTATVLEHPGLWNGAMAEWNSVFVEVSEEVFSPVKSVLDLLQRQHRPRN